MDVELLAGLRVVPGLGADAAFSVVFGVFVLAFAALVVLTLRWAIRRDRAGRAAWLHRQMDQVEENDRAAPPPSSNGHAPGRRGQRGKGPRRLG